MTSTLDKALKGTYVALYTPFSPDGSVDEAAYRALCGRLVGAGVGLVPCGTTGETPTLNQDEYRGLVSIAVSESAGRVPVIAGTGTNSTASTLKMTQVARDLGADAALVVTPYYNKPPQRSLIAHFTAVADGGGLPVMLYNVPGRTGCNMHAETTLKLAQHPAIVAVKEASGDLDQMQAVLDGAPAGFTVLSGDDALTLSLLKRGGHGVVSVTGNVAPALMVELVTSFAAGDVARAEALHRRLSPLFDVLFTTTNPIPVKRAASILGHGRADVRLPLTSDAMSEAMVAALHAALRVAEVGI